MLYRVKYTQTTKKYYYKYVISNKKNHNYVIISVIFRVIKGVSHEIVIP